MRDNTVHVRRGKKHPSRMEMIVLAALAALMVSGGTLLLLAALLGQDITDWNHRAAITAGLSLAGVVWGLLAVILQIAFSLCFVFLIFLALLGFVMKKLFNVHSSLLNSIFGGLGIRGELLFLLQFLYP